MTPIGQYSISEVEGVLRVDDQLIIKIQDTGCGMDKETTKKMFDPFFTTKEIGKGTELTITLPYKTV